MLEDQPGLDEQVKAELDHLDQQLEAIAHDMLVEDYRAAQTLLAEAEQAWRDREYDLANELFAQIREHVRSSNHVLIGERAPAPKSDGPGGIISPSPHQPTHRRPPRPLKAHHVLRSSAIALWWFGGPVGAFLLVRIVLMRKEALLAARCGSTPYCQDMYVNGVYNQWVLPVVIALCAIGATATFLYIIAGMKAAARGLRR